MEEVLLSVMYEVPSNPDVARVLITREVVLENVNPTIVPRSIAPRRRTPRTTARRSRPEPRAARVAGHTGRIARARDGSSHAFALRARRFY